MNKDNLSHRVRAFDAVVERITNGTPNSQVYIHQLRSAVAPLSQGMSALVAMLNNPDPTQTKSAFDKKIITTAAKLEDRCKLVFEKMQEPYRNGLLDVELKIGEKIQLKPNEHAAELRSVLRAMTPADRMAALMQMVAANDGPALAAFTEVSSTLSGLSVEEQNRFRGEILALHAKEECAERDALNKAFEAAMVATDVTKHLVQDLSNPGRLADIDKGVEAAAAADKAFAAAAA